MLAATAFAGQSLLPPPSQATGRKRRRAMSETLEDLVEAVGRHRDRAAFARLFDHFAPRLKGYLLRLGADDGQAEELVQEIMLLVWRRAETFDPRQAAASTWIFTIARNRRVDRLRRERRPELDPEDPALVGEAETAADTALAQRQTMERVQNALAGLPAEQAELLRLAYFDDTSHSRIAALKHLPLGTVKSRIRLALGRLRQALEAEDRLT